MPAPTGALGHFQALPFPARLAVGFLGMMGVIWLTRWLGGLSVPLALLLWCAVGIGIWRADGGLGWADRYPAATRVLDRFAPRFVMTLAPRHPWQLPSPRQRSRHRRPRRPSHAGVGGNARRKPAIENHGAGRVPFRRPR